MKKRFTEIPHKFNSNTSKKMGMVAEILAPDTHLTLREIQEQLKNRHNTKLSQSAIMQIKSLSR